jgi:azurin
LQIEEFRMPFAPVLSPVKIALRHSLVLVAAVCALWACARKSASAKESSEPVTLRVDSDGEFLAFTPPELVCPTGARVRVIFRHTGQRLPQEHNWVLTLPGASDAVAQAGAAAGPASGFVPAHDRRVLAATPLCGRGTEATVAFTAPPPGDYPFICTFPGHAAEMRGVLHVVAH